MISYVNKQPVFSPFF